jgi:hypothetical protein
VRQRRIRRKQAPVYRGLENPLNRVFKDAMILLLGLSQRFLPILALDELTDLVAYSGYRLE